MNNTVSFKFPFWAKLGLVILITVGLSEVMPEVINTVLILILLGLVLGHWQKFSALSQILGTVANGK